jgi:hypothetical protein
MSIIEEFRNTEKASKLILNAIKELYPTKGNRFGFFLSAVISIIVAFLIGFSKNTVTLFEEALEIVLNTQLALFGCIFAVYSIILTFLSDDIMRRLAEVRDVDNASSFLKTSTTYYESVLFLYFIGIGITGVLCLSINCIAEEFRLSNNLVLDNTLASILMLLYFVFTFRLFYEIKSAIYNTIVLFRGSIAYKFIGFAHTDAATSSNSEETHK